MPNFPERKDNKAKQERKAYAVKSFVNPLYHTKQWKALRLSVLRDEPLCRECRLGGKIEVAKVCDHVRPVRLGGEMWERSNLQPLCLSCHQRKSQSEKSKGIKDYD